MCKLRLEPLQTSLSPCSQGHVPRSQGHTPCSQKLAPIRLTLPKPHQPSDFYAGRAPLELVCDILPSATDVLPAPLPRATIPAPTPALLSCPLALSFTGLPSRILLWPTLPLDSLLPPSLRLSSSLSSRSPPALPCARRPLSLAAHPLVRSSQLAPLTLPIASLSRRHAPPHEKVVCKNGCPQGANKVSRLKIGVCKGVQQMVFLLGVRKGVR